MTEGARNVWRPYCQMKTAPAPLAVARTEGARIILEDGRELVDGIASWWTACHGYNHPHIREAVTRQLGLAPHVMFGGLAHEPAYRLASRLAALLPGDLDHVFFAESGSVSVEIAMKMALQFWINRGVTGRTRFLSFTGGYHGDTLATMTICDPDEGMHSLFAGVMPSQIVTPLPLDAGSEAALDALLAERGGEIAAMVVEPRVQGAGGMLFHGDEVLRTLRRLCDKHGVLLIFDEIFVGFGRTGDLFACSGSGVTPDIVTLSKALTGGTLPLSAAIARSHVFEAFWSDDAGAALMHGPTASTCSKPEPGRPTWPASIRRCQRGWSPAARPPASLTSAPWAPSAWSSSTIRSKPARSAWLLPSTAAGSAQWARSST